MLCKSHISATDLSSLVQEFSYLYSAVTGAYIGCPNIDCPDYNCPDFSVQISTGNPTEQLKQPNAQQNALVQQAKQLSVQ